MGDVFEVNYILSFEFGVVKFGIDMMFQEVEGCFFQSFDDVLLLIYVFGMIMYYNFLYLYFVCIYENDFFEFQSIMCFEDIDWEFVDF